MLEFIDPNTPRVLKGRTKDLQLDSKKQPTQIIIGGILCNVKESFGGTESSEEMSVVRRPKIVRSGKRVSGSPQDVSRYKDTRWTVFLKNVPSVNHIHGRSWVSINCEHCGKFVKKVPGYMFTTTKGKEFLESASLLLKTAIPLRGFEGKLVVEAFAHWPDRRARDMNNYAKFIADALQLGGVVKNDKTVLWREMNYKLDPGVQGFELTIYQEKQ